MKLRLFALFLCGLLFAFSVNAQKVTLRHIGKNNLFLTLTQYFNWRGALYSVDNQGVIYRTDLDSGTNTRIGKATYTRCKFFFGLNAKLYIIETDGGMTEIDPVTGDWKTASITGDWSLIERTIVVGNSLFAIENGSFFYYPTPNAKNRVQRGATEFFSPGALMRTESRLYSLIRDGGLYEINTSTGEWKTINKSKSWRNLKASQVLGDKFYAVDVVGNFTSFSLTDKSEKTLDSTQLGNARLLFAEAGKLFVIMNDGNFYEVKIGE